MSHKVVAIMPIKMNNERLPGKNTKLLGDKPLLQYELLNLKNIPQIQEICVYCSNHEIKAYLPKGIRFIERSETLDLPTANFTQIFQSFMEQCNADVYVYAHATAPFISLKTMQDCVDAVLSGRYDSAFCAKRLQDYLWQDGNPLNFDATNVPRTQDLKPIYQETSGIYVFKKEVFLKYRRRIGINPFIKEVSLKESIDIDEPEDFRIAETLLNLNL